ncbi:hypothetical protein L596_009637 [Steinernema carpocapsae]|uniref:Uncharacterized protein n=1 Tax=Steinernema carpocapsae TaxID=34508 RepID=A0A4U5PGQ4_STECR|nr:hypothetical protein L596_009637 [Steinernema carpocapsae]
MGNYQPLDFDRILDAFEDLANDQAKAIKSLEEQQMAELKRNVQKDRVIDQALKRMWKLAEDLQLKACEKRIDQATGEMKPFEPVQHKRSVNPSFKDSFTQTGVPKTNATCQTIECGAAEDIQRGFDEETVELLHNAMAAVDIMINRFEGEVMQNLDYSYYDGLEEEAQEAEAQEPKETKKMRESPRKSANKKKNKKKKKKSKKKRAKDARGANPGVVSRPISEPDLFEISFAASEDEGDLGDEVKPESDSEELPRRQVDILIFEAGEKSREEALKEARSR